MAVSIRWVRQIHEGGCGIASLAMLTGQTYAQVAADFSQPLEDGFVYDLIRSGPDMKRMDRYLAERGFAVCRLHLRDLFGPRTPWPPEPFADMHLCTVRVKQSSWPNHWVVMLQDGTVLDPIGPKPMRLTDYYLVLDVAAVVSIKTPQSTVFNK